MIWFARAGRVSGQRRDGEGASFTSCGPRGRGGVPADGTHPVADGAEARLPRDGIGDPGAHRRRGVRGGCSMHDRAAGPPSGRARRQRGPGPE